MRRKGETTVFLVMILFSTYALLYVAAESVRTVDARYCLQMAVDPSADSLMTQYHRELWNRHRILGLEYDKAETLEKELREFVRPYTETENWHPVKAEQIRMADMTDLTQGNERYLEQEILDYMKCGLLDADWDEPDETGTSEPLEVWKKGNNVNRVSELYAAHFRGAVKMEKTLETISSTLLAQRKQWEQGKDCLDQLDGGGLVSRANRLIRELERLPGQVNSYEKRADGLYEKLADSRERFLGKVSGLSGDMRTDLEEETRQYEAYAAQDGQRRREVKALTSLSRDRILWTRDVVGTAETVVEHISNWEPEDEDDELDEDVLWQSVKTRWSQYGIFTLGAEFGIRDKEKEGFLEQVGNMAGRETLELVLSEGTVVSGTALRLSGTPSVQRKTDGGGWREADQDGDSESTGFLTGVGALTQRLLTGEYGTRFLKRLKKKMQKGEFYELEYIIHRKEKDRDNLSGVAARLVAFKEGFNLIHILLDAGKRQETWSLTLTIAGGTEVLPPVSVVASLTMAVWTLGETLLDVRYLLEGRRVLVSKTGSDRKLDLVGLLEMGRNGSLIDEEGGNGSGADYKGYLRILIFGVYNTDLVYQVMDVMQIITAVKQSGFSLANYVCTMDAEALIGGKHMFFSNELWKGRRREDGYVYDARIAVVGSYLEGYKSP